MKRLLPHLHTYYCCDYYVLLILFNSESSETVLHSDDAFAPVAYLRLKSVRLRDKNVSSKGLDCKK